MLVSAPDRPYDDNVKGTKGYRRRRGWGRGGGVDIIIIQTILCCIYNLIIRQFSNISLILMGITSPPPSLSHIHKLLWRHI